MEDELCQSTTTNHTPTYTSIFRGLSHPGPHPPPTYPGGEQMLVAQHVCDTHAATRTEVADWMWNYVCHGRTMLLVWRVSLPLATDQQEDCSGDVLAWGRT
mmetsp:Transcript_67410/g.161689  ORF Transcript_67410/g.161689 Transcript_67410/m.161689 type:complete len:101 (+) Transcript_67410:1497-1799(+)